MSEGGDEFDRVFDDDFVSSATVKEPGWKERKRAESREQAFLRKAARTRRRRARLDRLQKPVLAVLAVAFVLGLLQLNAKRHQGHAATPVLAADDSASSTTSTSEVLRLDSRNFSVGDCVVWDTSDMGSRTRWPSIVPCDKPHVIQIAGRVTAPMSGRDPDEPAWVEFIAQACAPSASQLLGAPIDPGGRYRTSGMHPTPEGWAQGDRTVWCGVDLRPRRSPRWTGDKDAFTGDVRGARQEYVLPVGTCLAMDTWSPVACSEPHGWEVSGAVDLTGKTAQAPAENDSEGWSRLLSEPCHNAAAAYLGHAPAGRERSGWIPIKADSFAAGSHTAECLVGRADAAGNLAATTGSMKG